MGDTDVCRTTCLPLHFRMGRCASVDKLFRVLKHTLVGTLEAISLGLMVGASKILTPVGTFLILIGLCIGVMGLAIYDVWRV